MAWYSPQMLQRILDEADPEGGQRAWGAVGKAAARQRLGYRHRADRVPVVAQMFISIRTGDVRTMHYVVAQRFDVRLGGDVIVTMPCGPLTSRRSGNIAFETPETDLRLFWFPGCTPTPFCIWTDEIALSTKEPSRIYRALGKIVDVQLADALLPKQRPAKVIGAWNG